MCHYFDPEWRLPSSGGRDKTAARSRPCRIGQCRTRLRPATSCGTDVDELERCALLAGHSVRRRTGGPLAIRSDTELVEIVVPVHNEVQTLEATIARLREYLDRSFPFSTLVTIADNASIDGTDTLARSLAASLDGVQVVHLDEKGRGRALRTSWVASRAKVVAYMDADLATGLEALFPLVAPLLAGHSDVAIGSRLAGGAHVIRGPRRELISRCCAYGGTRGGSLYYVSSASVRS